MEETRTKKKKDQSEIFASCSFSSLGLHPTLCTQLQERMGFEAPTVVQAQAIPVVLSGRHTCQCGYWDGQNCCVFGSDYPSLAGFHP
ncbi:hypothetical protein Tsubulata_044168 [Turnera subulata]|uniref:DEAD-box RNA helicase Q domain-containing protein n=1 Tax=Turnera subulata TaxID=218843 RepID=A0A9Q0FX59_9ROSI|nr:hypothetical protein Tsubulata_044168 [Turnera subulata]